MSHAIRTAAIVLAAVLVAGCAARDESAGLPLTVHVVETSGTEYDVSQIRQPIVRVQPVTTHIGGAESLEAELTFLKEVRQQEQHRISTLTFLDSSSVAGRLNGNLEGISNGMPVAVPWQSISVATFQHHSKPEQFEPPKGPWIRVSGEGTDQLDLYGLEVVSLRIVRHGTHAYRRDSSDAGSLPFTVPRERMIREEWEIPTDNLDRIELYPYLKKVIVDVGGNEPVELEGEFGGQLRQQGGGDALLMGRDRRGTWTLSLDRLHREVRLAGVGRSADERALQITVQVFGRQQHHEGRLAGVTPVGQMTDWDNRTLPVAATWFEPLEFRLQDGSRSVFNPETVAGVEIFEDPWTSYDHERSFSEQWLQAKLTLRDGSVLAGRLKDRFGYLECVGERGIPMYVPSYSVRRLTLSAWPSSPPPTATAVE